MSHEVTLEAPLDERTVRALRVGEVVYVSGTIATLRDEGHIRALGSGALPVNMEGGVLYHCGPLVVGEGKTRRVVAAGPTTSSRMNGLEGEMIRTFGIRAIIGKGGMDASVRRTMADHGCVYLALTGGCAAVAADSIREIIGVHWEDLGMPEAMWVFRVELLGPLVVAIDTNGSSLYETSGRYVSDNLKSLVDGWSTGRGGK